MTTTSSTKKPTMHITSTLRFLRHALFCAGAATFALSSAQAQTLVYEYKFNDAPGTSSASTGSTTTSANFYNTAGASTNLFGAGVSGLAGDYSFDNTASTRMGGTDSVPSGGSARVADSGSLDLMTSFTLQGWYKIAPDVTGDYANNRIINKASTQYFVLQNSRTGANGTLTLSLSTGTGPTTVTSSGNSLLGESDWVFFAVTYDSTLASNNIKFYAGTTDDSVVLVSQHTYLAGATGTNSATMFFGANAGANTRPFDGWLDNIRIYKNDGLTSGALSLGQLEALRFADAIPEPSTAALMVFAALLLARRGRRG